jgi:hypothetical protein
MPTDPRDPSVDMTELPAALTPSDGRSIDPASPLGPQPSPAPSRSAVRRRLRRAAVVIGAGVLIVAVFTAGAGLERVGALRARGRLERPTLRL